jgi:hypothetical protein
MSKDSWTLERLGSFQHQIFVLQKHMPVVKVGRSEHNNQLQCLGEKTLFIYSARFVSCSGTEAAQASSEPASGTDVLIFLNIFAKKSCEKIGVFCSKQSYIMFQNIVF